MLIVKNLPRKNENLGGFISEFNQTFKEEIIAALPSVSLENREGESSQLLFFFYKKSITTQMLKFEKNHYKKNKMTN